MKPSPIFVAAVALLGSCAGCHRAEARRPLSERPVYVAPTPAAGPAPAYRPAEGS